AVTTWQRRCVMTHREFPISRGPRPASPSVPRGRVTPTARRDGRGASGLAPADVVRLQRAVGNRATTSLVAQRAPITRALAGAVTISGANDRLEVPIEVIF